MTDTEVKTPNKRKSLAAQTPGKKAKLENGAVFTPSKKAFNKNTPKQKSPKPNQKPGNKNASPKQVKPFEGTAKLQDKDKKKNKKADNESGDKQVAGEGKKRRKNQFHHLVSLIRSDDPSQKQEGLKKIEDKIRTIESRPDQTKTSKRKLNWLRTQKNILEGKPPKEHTKTNLKSESQKRRERKQKGQKNAAVKQDKPAKGGKKQKQQPAKKEESDDDEESSEEEDSNVIAAEDSSSEEQEAEAASDEESGEEEAEEESGDEEEDDDDDDNEEGGDESDEESEEEEAPKLVALKDQKPDFKTKRPKRENPSKPQKNDSKSPEVKPQKINSESPDAKAPKPQIKEKKDVSLDDLKRKDLIAKNQKRFVLFVGNIPYDTTKQDLIGHFSKAGDIMHVRIPLEQKSNKPRGFAYLELTNEETYQKCLSMHHSFMKNRRLNVLYTQGGKKKGDDKKKEIKAKNMKLHAMRKQGQLAGSVKESNKRSFRRAKKRNISNKEGESNE